LGCWTPKPHSILNPLAVSVSLKRKLPRPLSPPKAYVMCAIFAEHRWCRSRCSRLLLRNVQRFPDGLVSKAHRLCVSLNSRLDSHKKEKEGGAKSPGQPYTNQDMTRYRTHNSTQWSTTILSKPKLPHVINLSALCGANLIM